MRPGSGGLFKVTGVIFGPDGNGDGTQDLYVGTAKFTGAINDNEKSSQIKRYDGVSGFFLDTFVAPGNKLDGPILMSFTETDPMTLAYNGS